MEVGFRGTCAHDPFSICDGGGATFQKVQPLAGGVSPLLRPYPSSVRNDTLKLDDDDRERSNTMAARRYVDSNMGTVFIKDWPPPWPHISALLNPRNPEIPTSRTLVLLHVVPLNLSIVNLYALIR